MSSPTPANTQSRVHARQPVVRTKVYNFTKENPFFSVTSRLYDARVIDELLESLDEVVAHRAAHAAVEHLDHLRASWSVVVDMVRLGASW